MAVVLVLLPAAEVLDEAPGVIGAARDFGARARLPKIGVNTLAQQRHIRRAQHLPQTHCPVAAKGFDIARRDLHTVPAFTSTIFAGSMCFLIARFTSSSVRASIARG